MNMQDVRTNVAARVIADDDTIRPDILNPGATHDNLIRLLDVLTAPTSKGGHGVAIEVTALHRDHHDDGDLGPHGHNPHGKPGWAVDLVLKDDPYLQNRAKVKAVILWLITSDHYVTKIGGPAWLSADSDIMTAAARHNVVVFVDIGTGPHIHLQSDETK